MSIKCFTMGPNGEYEAEVLQMKPRNVQYDFYKYLQGNFLAPSDKPKIMEYVNSMPLSVHEKSTLVKMVDEWCYRFTPNPVPSIFVFRGTTATSTGTGSGQMPNLVSIVHGMPSVPQENMAKENEPVTPKSYTTDSMREPMCKEVLDIIETTFKSLAVFKCTASFVEKKCWELIGNLHLNEAEKSYAKNTIGLMRGVYFPEDC